MLIEHSHAIVGEMKRRMAWRARNEKRVLRTLEDAVGSLSTKQIAALARIPERTARRTVKRLLGAGEIDALLCADAKFRYLKRDKAA